jgi:S1-C subfamily serine protease
MKARTMEESVRRQVEAATVKLTGAGGQGVLVSGGFVLTAMHCMGWDGTAGLVLGDHHAVAVQTHDGTKFRLQPWFADVVSDMGALGETDEDWESFEEWREKVKAVPIRSWKPVPWAPPMSEPESLAVHVLSHEGTWISGKVTNYSNRPNASISLETDQPIKGGTSGGPVVDDDGLLVGVISWSSGQEGSIPVACLSLPPWVLLQATTVDTTEAR